MALKIQWGNTPTNFSNLGSGRSFNWWFSSNSLQFSSLISSFLPPNLWMPTPFPHLLLHEQRAFCRTTSQGKKSLAPDHRRYCVTDLHKAKNMPPLPRAEVQWIKESPKWLLNQGWGDHNWGRTFVGTRSWELVPHTDPLLVNCRLINMCSHFSVLAHPYRDSRTCNWFYWDIVFKTSACWGGKFFLPPF